VRELENVIERALVLAAGNLVEETDVDLPVTAPDVESASFKVQKARAVYEFEHRFLEDALVRHSGNISQAAKSVAKHRSAFFHLLRKHNLTNQNQGTRQASSLAPGSMGL
jgi:DNA-binding NtrC family response regulator